MSAESELRAKLALEREFHPKLEALFREMVSTYAVGVEFHQVPRFQDRASAPLIALLLAHFIKTGSQFNNLTGSMLPRSVKPTGAELAEIEVTLTQLFEKQAPEQARLILDTTDRQAQTAHITAQNVEKDPSLIGAVATGLFARGLFSRLGRIRVLETQLPAEQAKFIEAGVLDPSASTMKKWVTQLDSRVRSAHANAHGQRVTVDRPFTVGGQSLNFPGDTSLGATIGNVINCRCSVAYDIKGIAEVRKK